MLFLPLEKGKKKGCQVDINPDVLSVLLNLTSSTLYSLLCLWGQKASELAIGNELQMKWEHEKTSVDPLLRQAIRSLAEHFAWTYDKGEEVTALFLCTREVEELTRQCYSIRLVQANGNALPSLRTLFSTLLLQFLSQYPLEVTPQPEEQKVIADALFDALVQTSNVTLSAAADQGLLAAHEALSSYRHHIIQGQLASIQKRLDFFLACQQHLDIPAIFQYEQRYRRQVEGRHGSITPPHFDTTREIPLDDLYVFPTLQSVSEHVDEKRQQEDQIVSVEEFLPHIQRTVVLGNPGGGKSTLAQKICHHLAASDKEQQIRGGRPLTPILVTLRKYGVAKQDQRCSIREYIETEFEATYQLPPAPVHTLEYVLLNGHMLVIFDGLDELLETSSRQEIRDDVQSFCTLYPSTPVLVTSREVGYEQAPLHCHVFQVFRLENLDDQQVRAYVQKWFTVAGLYSSLNERQQKVEDFLKESQSVSDLRSNPLMLALMCNIYRGENYIPRNRPEVYQKCADMLFERWDRSRNILALIPFEAHIRPAMMYLAHWIYTNEALRAGVTEQLLVEKATDYLRQKRFADCDEAEQAARTFISFCRGRAWVFTDTGTEKDGERLYQFTHQTFLEYFTAVFLVRTHTTPESLLESLLAHIEEREWDVVAQLAIHRQHRQSEDAGDQVLSSLLAYTHNVENMKQWNVLDFTVRCLQFLVPSPQVVSNVTEKLILKLIQWGSERQKRGKPSFNLGHGQKALSDVEYQTCNSLLSAAVENRTEIAHIIEQSLLEKIRNGEEEEKISAFALNDYLHGQPYIRARQRINQSCAGIKRNLYPRSVLLCHAAVQAKEVSLENFLAWHGFEHIFHGHSYYMFPNVRKVALSIQITLDLLFGDSNQDPLYFEQVCLILERVGNLAPVPAYIYRDFSPAFFLREDRMRHLKQGRFKELQPSVLFGIFVLFAAYREGGSSFLEKIDYLKKKDRDFYNFLQYVVPPRHVVIEQELIQKQLDNLKFSPEQQEVIWKWIKQEIHFTKGA